MVRFDEIQQYFRKLQRVIRNEADFTFFDVKLIKKEKIDDLLCCLLAVLPENYKRLMKQHQDESERLDSIVCYNSLFQAIKRKCPLSNKVYVVEHEKALRLIIAITKCIEKDIEYLEKADKQ